MSRKFILFAALLFAGLIAGGQYVVLWDYHPGQMSAGFYTEKMQHAIGHIGSPLFSVQIIAAIFTIISAIIFRNTSIFYFLTIASVCCVTGVLLTFFGAIPILNEIGTWNTSSPPANWHDAAQNWWYIHTVRFLIQLGAFLLLLASAFRFDRGVR
jgi:hypothetical protein